ncbi:MAG: pyridoxal-phosphate dependent enzyme, partial [Bythopirellula sp.]
VQALRDSNGVVVRVSDEQLLEAIRRGGKHGVFAEPAAAAALAGITSGVESKIVGQDDFVVAMMTGTGLKDIRSSIRAGGEPIRIEPNLDAVATALDRD